MTIVLHARSYGKFMEIKSKIHGRERNFIEQIKAPIFLEAILAGDTM